MVDKLSEMLLTLLNQVRKQHNQTIDLLDRTLEVTKSSGDKILFKGSRGMAMETVIQGVFE